MYRGVSTVVMVMIGKKNSYSYFLVYSEIVNNLLNIFVVN